MKKIALLFAFVEFSICAIAQHTSPRFGVPPAGDNTGQSCTYAYLTPSYDDTLTLKPNAYETTIKVGNLTGTVLLSSQVTNSYVGDRMVVIFYGTGSRTVTFNTNIVASASTLVVDSLQKATWSAVFDGAKWIETARAKE